MTTTESRHGRHPELDAEQAHIDHAYDCLQSQRERALRLRSMVEVGRGGTNQARWEREVFEGNINHRLSQLQLGSASLVFGRIDDDDAAFHIGRLAVADDDQEPIVVDWRAPVVEPFYRATGREPMGLRRRRHFVTRGRELLDIEDEVFDLEGLASGEIQGYGALMAALEQSRTGQLTDIVATIQGEQDEIIRDQLRGIVVVQGGPGTGKTVVALHRAAYLLYTHRFPLEGQGVLVVAPNRLFLRYVERVLPSLGEAGVHLIVLADLLEELMPDVRVADADPAPVAEVKAGIGMVDVIAGAVRDRERALREDLVVPYGVLTLRVTAGQSRQLVRDARRRYRTHNAARRFVEAEFFRMLAASHRSDPDPDTVRLRLRDETVVRQALEWMWPVLAPAQLLRDLFGSRALLRSAGMSDAEADLLYRQRGDELASYWWSDSDVPLLDEAYSRLGPRPSRRHDDPEARTYGHIVIDEAQDHTPMALRMLARRSLNGSMTVVGDIAQATAPGGASSWDDVLRWLPHGAQPPRVRDLTLGYRIPAPNMGLAARVLAEAEPTLEPPRSVRTDGSPPRIVGADADGLADAVVSAALEERVRTGGGSVAVICPRSLIDGIEMAFVAAGVEHGRATTATRHATGALRADVTLIPVPLVKGLELDAAVVVEPARIVDEEPRGLRSLYVALTRATKRLSLVHAEPLPAVLAEQVPAHLVSTAVRGAPSTSSKPVAAVLALVVGVSLAIVVAPAVGSQPSTPPKAVQVAGAATYHGDPSGTRLPEPVVAIAATSSAGGYWLTTSNGAVLAYGDAQHRGSAEHIDLWEPIVGMSPTSTGQGYWLVATDGGVFTYGDARFHGSAGGIDLWAPIVGMAPTSSGRGYWLVASDGGIFTYGDAGFFGSAGALPLVAPVVGMAATPTGRGYWLVAADGGVFTFGDARFYGSGVEQHGQARSAVGIAALVDGGYVVAGDNGSVLRFRAGAPPAAAGGPVDGFVGVAIAAHPTQVGWWIAGRSVVDQMTVWQPGGLRGGTTDAAFAAAASVGARATLFHGGALAVTAARRNGAPVVSASPGWRLSYSAEALEPSENELFIGPDIASVLRAGDVIVGARTSQRTGITVNDVIDFIGWDGQPHSRRVGAIGTPSEVGDTELTFSVADARSFGFVRPTAVRIWNFPSRGAVEAAATRFVPAGQIGVDVTWRDSGRDDVLSTARLKEEMGEFEFRPLPGDPIQQQPSWAAANLVHVNLPILGPMTCHRRIVSDLIGALTEVGQLGLAGTLDVGDTRSYGGCYNPRLIRSFEGGDSGGSLSRHSWGAALDVNPSTNPFGGAPNLDRRLVDVFHRWGFAWGGTWVRPDGNHFEWVGR